jgi:D-alanyl-D-alanine-carboxypeptidase/D-alanyl-D-alanine-endopeptidase
MSAVLGSSAQEPDKAFISKIREHLFEPLDLHVSFFDEVSLAELPLGFQYTYLPSPTYTATQPGHVFWPAYFGASGIVATPRDMLKWLQFNMGITFNKRLTPMLSAVQTPTTGITEPDYGYQLGLGWFIRPAAANDPGLILKDGAHEGFNSYIGFLPSAKAGCPSDAGAFVLVNADGIRDALDDTLEMPVGVTNDLLRLMQKKPLANRAAYPRVVLRRAARGR